MIFRANGIRTLSVNEMINATFGPVENRFQFQALTLNLKETKLDTEGVKLLSDRLSERHDLEYLNLNLGMNSIRDNQLIDLSQALEKLQKLSSLQLNLSSNKIQDPGVKALSSALSKLKSLESLYLDLKFNAVTSVSLDYLAAALESLLSLQNLTLFILDGNRIESGINNQFANSLSKLSLLQSLNLKFAGGYLTIPDTEKINFAFSKITQLSNLALVFQGEFKDKALENITKGISKLSKLESFSLTWVYQELNAQSMKYLSNSFSSLINLKQLTIILQNNNINEQGFEYLFSGISKLKHITQLNLQFLFNLISEKRASDLFSAISQFHNLTNFQLSLQFSSVPLNGAFSLSNCIRNLLNLTNLSLDLEGNQFGEKGLKYITENLKQSPQLKVLDINIDHEMAESGFKEIFINISNLSNLQGLSLRVQDISKTIETKKVNDLSTCFLRFRDLVSLKICFSEDKRKIYQKEQKQLRKAFMQKMPKLVIAFLC